MHMRRVRLTFSSFVAPLPLPVMRWDNERLQSKTGATSPCGLDGQRAKQVFVKATSDVREIRLQFEVPDDNKKGLYRELCLLQFLALISQDWPHLEYVEEQMSTVESEFQDGKEHEFSFAMNVGEIMFFRDLERSSLLSSISTISRFNPWAIPRFLRFLHPHNM